MFAASFLRDREDRVQWLRIGWGAVRQYLPVAIVVAQNLPIDFAPLVERATSAVLQ